ncbi:MAG: cell division protein FtsZ [Paramuribaculum sp.]|nr:cell division protein FtsZ [Paramuribaculum sp.]
MDGLDIDALAQSLSGTPMEDNDIMVVGVGGGGGNAVNHMFREGVKNVTFVVCNTDKAAVENSPVANKVVIGNGKGAGNKPDVARKFAEDDIDKIEAIFNNNARMVFVTAGMGGGTGTGAGPVVARVAKEKGLLTIGIVTIPFIFEGRKKIIKALDGADEMSKYVDALLIINNERLTEIYPDLTFFNAFGKADDTVATAARSISEIITIDGYMNLDFNDVDTTLRDGGTAIISTGEGEGEHRVTKALQNALNSPLLKNRDIYGSRKLLINLYMSDSENTSMAMHEVQELREFVLSIDDEVDVIWGVAVDNSLGEKVKITVLASGFDVTIRDEEQEVLDSGQSLRGGAQPKDTATYKPKKSKPTPPADDNDRLKQEYGKGIDILTTSYVILSPDQMDDDTVIDQLERAATFNRDKRLTEALKKGSMPAPLPGTPEPPAQETTTRICF